MSSRTFSPQQLELVYDSIEHIAEVFYRRGQEDQAAGKSLKTEEFRLSKASRLALKTNLNKALNKR